MVYHLGDRSHGDEVAGPEVMDRMRNMHLCPHKCQLWA